MYSTTEGPSGPSTFIFREINNSFNGKGMNQNDSVYHLVTDSSHLNGGDRTCPECRRCDIHHLIRRRDCLYRVDSLDHAKDLQTQMRRRPINLGLFSFIFAIRKG